jgi:excisionase family DNA binding protein
MSSQFPADQSTDDVLWDVKDVARYLKASNSWVYKAAERGELPTIRIGAMLRFDPAAIRVWLEAKKRGAGSLTVTGIESVTSKSAPSK